MSDQIRITIEHIVEDKVHSRTIVTEKQVTKAACISDLGFNHKEQIDILKSCQEGLLQAQSPYLKEDITSCPKCSTKLKFSGTTPSEFHSVFSDHKVATRRQKCCNRDCGWTSVPSITSLFNTNVHPDLSKLQVEKASDHTYRETQILMNMCSYYERKINNHERIYRTVEVVGNYISNNQVETISEDIEHANELILQVDGGHLKSKEDDERSFEALTSVVYSPKNVIYKKKKDTSLDSIPRGEIISKHCAASALEDNLETIKHQTLMAAKKQGLTLITNITALCDGASNCWSVVSSLEKECQSITKILDWYHIAQRFKNISLSEELNKELKHIKWCVWHDKADEAINRFDLVIDKVDVQQIKTRLVKLKNYLENNKDYLVNYAKRYEKGDVIASSLAESNVESLINKRCKSKQHMKWSREGVHPLLQIRAAKASNDWTMYGSSYVLNATTLKAA